MNERTVLRSRVRRCVALTASLFVGEINVRIRTLCVLALSLLCTPSAGVFAQTYPAKSVLVIVPLAAASASDVAVRTLTERLSKTFGQQVVVENQPGAAG